MGMEGTNWVRCLIIQFRGEQWFIVDFGKQQKSLFKRKKNPRLIKSQMVNLHALIIPQCYCVAFTLLWSQSPLSRSCYHLKMLKVKQEPIPGLSKQSLIFCIILFKLAFQTWNCSDIYLSTPLPYSWNIVKVYIRKGGNSLLIQKYLRKHLHNNGEFLWKF